MATNEIKQIVSIEANLTKIQGDLRSLEGNFKSSFGRIQATAASALGALTGGLSVAALVGMSRQVLDLADSLQNLHEQTGLSVQLLSGFKSTLEESGTSIDAFARGVFNLQKNLGNVDKATDPAAQAIKRLGLNLDDLRNSSPDDFIKKVTDALAQIQNPVERNTILFNLLGKSAKELGPAFQQLVGRFQELRANGLSAADVKTLDDVGDALTRLKNQALLLGAEGVAGLLRFFGAIRDGGKVAAQLDSATERAAKLFNLPKGRVEGMTSREIIAQAETQPETFTQSRQGFRNARDDLLNLREEFNRLNAVNVTKPQAVFKGISEGAKTAKKDVDNLVDSFLDGLQKQLTALEGKKVELTLGADAALGQGLSAQLEALKENLRAKNLPVPKGLDEFFGVLKDKIVASNRALTDLNESLEETTKRQQALADEANEGVGIQFLKAEDVAKQHENLKRLTDQFKELQKSLAIEILPEDQQAGARAAQEFEERIKAINEWRDAAIAAGGDVATKNAEAAQATADAWQAMGERMKDSADDASEFTRRAFERGFDAVSNAFEDFLNGEITSFEEFGKKLLKTINSLLADQLTLEFKKLFLGEDFGKKGAGIGGILGGLFGTNQKANTRLPGTTAADTLDAERGRELREAAAQSADQAAIAAIQTQAANVNAGIQAVTTQSSAAIDASVATGQTTLEAVAATTQSAIEAMKAAALAAIEAAKSSGAVSGGGFASMFGSSSGGAPESAIGGAFDAFELGMWHRGGEIKPGRGSSGITYAALPKFHGGGEVPIMAQSGEYMMNRWSAISIGRKKLDYMNQTGAIPQSDGGGNRSGERRIVQNININATDAGSFQRSKRAVARQLSSAMRRND